MRVAKTWVVPLAAGALTANGSPLCAVSPLPGWARQEQEARTQCQAQKAQGERGSTQGLPGPGEEFYQVESADAGVCADGGQPDRGSTGEPDRDPPDAQ